MVGEATKIKFQNFPHGHSCSHGHYEEKHDWHNYCAKAWRNAMLCGQGVGSGFVYSLRFREGSALKLPSAHDSESKALSRRAF